MDVLLVLLRVLMVIVCVGAGVSLGFLWMATAPTGAGIAVSALGTVLCLALVWLFLWMAFGTGL